MNQSSKAIFSRFSVISTVFFFRWNLAVLVVYGSDLSLSIITHNKRPTIITGNVMAGRTNVMDCSGEISLRRDAFTELVLSPRDDQCINEFHVQIWRWGRNLNNFELSFHVRILWTQFMKLLPSVDIHVTLKEFLCGMFLTKRHTVISYFAPVFVRYTNQHNWKSSHTTLSYRYCQPNRLQNSHSAHHSRAPFLFPPPCWNTLSMYHWSLLWFTCLRAPIRATTMHYCCVTNQSH